MRFTDQATTAFAGEQVTVSTVAIGGTSATYSPVVAGTLQKSGPHARKCYLTTESNSIRVRWDGTDPTAAIGHLLTAGSSLTITGAKNISQLRMIRVSADATVQLTYER